MRVLVMVPTYDEADNILTLLDRASAAVPEAHVLVIDDGSPDGTADVVEARCGADERVHLLRRPGKAGLGSAYRAGMAWGMEHGFDVLVEIDADLSHDPADLPRLLAAVDDGADLVIGSRYVPGGAIPDWSRRRRALSSWGNRYAGAMLGLDVADATAGYRAYRREILQRVHVETVTTEGYGFQIEMTDRVARCGGRIVEVPIVFTDRTAGASKMSSRIVVEALTMVTAIGLRRRLSSLGRGSGARRVDRSGPR